MDTVVLGTKAMAILYLVISPKNKKAMKEKMICVKVRDQFCKIRFLLPKKIL